MANYDLLRTLRDIQLSSPAMGGKGLTQSFESLLSNITRQAQEKRIREQSFQDAIRLAITKAQIERMNPMTQFLEKTKMAEGLKNMADLGIDVSQYRGMFGDNINQPIIPNREIIDTTGEDLGSISPNIRPTKYERTAFGGIKPTTYERIKIPEEQMEELTADQKNAITATKNSLALIKKLKEQLSEETEEGKYKYPTGGRFPSFRYSALPGAGYIMAQRGTTEEAQLNATIRKLQAEFIKAQTGAQRGFKEMSFLLPALPMLDYQNNKMALGVLKSAKEDMESYLNQMTGIEKTQTNQPPQSNQQYKEGQTATNPNTGEQLIYRGGRWLKR